jgi:hypothetical protein
MQCLLFAPCAEAFSLKAIKNNKRTTREYLVKTHEKEVREIFKKQMAFANKHDIEGLSNLYSDEFSNNDGFNKEVYLQLIKDTWTTYPDIAYKSEVRVIDVKPFYATVEATEIASAAVGDAEFDDRLSSYGELYIKSRSIYHFAKRNGSWKIVAEEVVSEQSSLKFGQAKYIDMEFSTPDMIPANKEYISTIKVNLPENVSAIAAISKSAITYPQNKGEDKFRNISDDGLLQRILTANRDNLNEYNVASVAVGHASETSIAMTGAAFLMTRINVIPVNNFVEDVKSVENKIKQEAESLKSKLNGEFDRGKID